MSKFLPGLKTHITAILLLILQGLHAAGYITDKGAQASSWTLAALMGIFLRMAFSQATAMTHAKLDAIKTDTSAAIGPIQKPYLQENRPGR